MIILIHGLPGSGKTTISKMVNDSLNGIYFSTDEIRKILFHEQNYNINERELTYKSIAIFVEKIDSKKPIIIDATFSRNVFRNIFDELAKRMDRKIFYIKCICTEKLCLQRITNRKKSFSDADENVFHKVKNEWEEYCNNISPLKINTEKDESENIKEIFEYLHVPNQKVPLTPQHVNLVNKPSLLEKWLQNIHEILNKNNIEYYIQSSLAGFVYGIENRNVTDIDLRANYNIDKLFALLQSKFDEIRIRGEVIYAGGEFRNKCIIIELPELDTHIDITTDIITYRKDIDVVFNVPFDQNYSYRRIHKKIDTKFPVCSIQYLIIYKLINQRGNNERKNDLKEAANLLLKTF